MDTENAEFWKTTAMKANYALLEANSAEYSTGLFDNWSDASGKGLDGNYGYDAARTPWRLAQDFYWFGEEKAKTMLDKLGKWVSGNAAKNIRGNINRNGSVESWAAHNSTFVATLMTSLVTDASRQGKLDEFWSEAVSLGEEAYFEQSLKILCGLLVSGNMPNLAAATPSDPTSSSSTPASSSSVESSSSNGTIALPTLAASAPKMTLSGRTLEFSANGDVRVDVISMTGNVVKSFNKNATGSVSVSLNAIPSGLYIVRVKNAGVSNLKKIKLD